MVMVSSNTGGLGGVMLHIEGSRPEHTAHQKLSAHSTANCGRKIRAGETHLWRLRASLMEFFTTRQLLLAGRGDEASGSSMLGSL